MSETPIIPVPIISVTPILPKRKAGPGRPKGSKTQQGLSLERRLRVLQKIILDTTQKTGDRLVAIKTMTELLSDKVKTPEVGGETMVLKFEENTPKPIKIDNKPEIIKHETPVIIVKPADNQIVTGQQTSNTTSTITTQVIKQEEVKQDNVLEFSFEIDKENE